MPLSGRFHPTLVSTRPDIERTKATDRSALMAGSAPVLTVSRHPLFFPSVCDGPETTGACPGRLSSRSNTAWSEQRYCPSSCTPQTLSAILSIPHMNRAQTAQKTQRNHSGQQFRPNLFLGRWRKGLSWCLRSNSADYEVVGWQCPRGSIG